MLQWMAKQAKTKTAKESSIGAALKNFIPSKYSNISTANEQFIQHFKDNALNLS